MTTRGNPFAGKRALVTGATGFIGFALRQRLLDLGAEVHGVSRRKPADEDTASRIGGQQT